MWLKLQTTRTGNVPSVPVLIENPLVGVPSEKTLHSEAPSPGFGTSSFLHPSPPRNVCPDAMTPRHCLRHNLFPRRTAFMQFHNVTVNYVPYSRRFISES